MAYRDDFILGRSEPAWLQYAPRPAVAHNILDFEPPRRVTCPEIECVRRLFPWQTMAWAEHRAAEIGVGADRVLIAAGLISDEHYLSALAAWLGVGYLPLEDVPRTACPLGDFRLIDAAQAGMLPLNSADGLVWVVAPRNLAARTLTRLISRNRRVSNGVLYLMAADAALNHPVSKQWCGYWQRSAK